MKERRTLLCSQCHQTFSYLIQLPERTSEHNLIVKVNCPFCNAKLRVDLSPYQRREVEIYRQGGASQKTGSSLDLPAELPAQLDD